MEYPFSHNNVFRDDPSEQGFGYFKKQIVCGGKSCSDYFWLVQLLPSILAVCCSSADSALFDAEGDSFGVENQLLFDYRYSERVQQAVPSKKR